MKVYIKNMVCLGTKQLVIQEIEKLGIIYNKFVNSEIELAQDLTLPEIKSLEHALQLYGLQIEFKKSNLVSRICSIVHDMIDNNMILREGLSKYLSNRLGYNYYYLNTYFFRETGHAIEEYYVARKEDSLKEKTRRNVLMGHNQNIFI